MSYIWPIILVVFSNIIYQIATKSVPKNMDPMASLTVTYVVGAICSTVMYFLMNKNGNLLVEYQKLNQYPFLLGVSIVGLEVGFIYAYKAGWPISTASIVQSAFLSLALIVVGALLYQETISANKIIGIIICLFGLWLINKSAPPV